MLAQEVEELDAVWLYGSHAKNIADDQSDYDLAVAFSDGIDSKFNSGYPCDELSYLWSNATGETISIVNINKIPIPLAYSVIQEGKVLLSRDNLRLHSEMQRIWSLWESYRYEHKKQRK